MEISAWTQSVDAKAMKQGEEEVNASSFQISTALNASSRQFLLSI
jgi:hypothetical protein